MLELLYAVLQREVIIASAIVGAIVATVGSFMMPRAGADTAERGRLLLHLGYAITGASVFLFILAGLIL
jgi:multisubunit Na+/H+ antiporter MnhE subunit